MENNIRVLLLVVLTIVLAFRAVADAFIIQQQKHQRITYLGRQDFVQQLNAVAGNGDDSNEENNDGGDGDNDDDEDVAFYEDLRKAKKELMGGEIPKDQLVESAQEAQNEFLKAMEDVGREFQETKSKLGSDAAIDLMMEHIRIEDEKREQQQVEGELGENNDNDDDGDEFK